jgi:hypothetical protein
MPSKLMRALKRLTVEPVAFDPSTLGDDLAMKTEWGPASGGGASFGTHRLVSVDPDRLEFKATPGAVLFYALFFVVGLAVVVGFAIAIATGSVGAQEEGLLRYVPLGIGAVFTVVGGSLLYSGVAPIVFDRRRGEYWKGRVAPSDVADPAGIESHTDLDRIHALQVISEHCRGNKSSYYSYELNLVLDDGMRLAVVDHGDLDRVRADAATLARFLDRPVWDATLRGQTA